MLDDNTTRAKIVRAALELAEQQGWHTLTLAQIAERAGVPLADALQELGSRTAILKAFSDEVDREVLGKIETPRAEDPPRDRIFNAVMTRFEVLEPYKGAIRRIYADTCCAPDVSAAEIACTSLRSQYRMLTAAGIRADGTFGSVRTAGLLGVYARVMPVWLKDDEPGLSRTMAALDKHLRRGEFWLGRLDSVCGKAGRIAACFMPRRRDDGGPERGPEPAPGGAGEAAPPGAGQPSAG